MNERLVRLLLLTLLVWAVVSTGLLISCTNSKENKEETVSINIGLKYEGNLVWYNDTEVPAGSSLLEATAKIADVEYKRYPYGAFIESINGIKNRGSMYWIWWMWNDKSGWTLGPVGADRYVVGDGETYIWYYEDTSKYPPAKP